MGIFLSLSLSLLRKLIQCSAPPPLSPHIHYPLSVLGTADLVLPEDASLQDTLPRYPSRVRHPLRRYLPEYGIWS